MTTVVVFAAGGVVSWLLRAAFIVFVPSGEVATRLAAALRYAAPAAFAAMAATTLTAAMEHPGRHVWPFVLATLAAVLAARISRNLAVTIAVSVTAVSVLTAL